MKWLIIVSAVFIWIPIVDNSSAAEPAVYFESVYDDKSKEKTAAHWDREGTRRRLQSQFPCYTCTSHNVPADTRAILSKTIKLSGLIPVTTACDAPFENSFPNRIPTESCGTICIKITNENKKKSIPQFVVRGCFVSSENKSMTLGATIEVEAAARKRFVESCHRIIDSTGERIAELCSCTKNFCNHGNYLMLSEHLMYTALALFFASWRVQLQCKI